MRIGIDCRMGGTGEGIARYVEELVAHLAEIDSENDYFLLLRERASSKFKIQNSKFRNVLVKSPYYSFAEQTRFIGELKKLKLDLAHFPSFNVPILYPGKFVVTIHDIIHHLYPGKKKARWFHRLAYRWVINSAIKRASKIIAVSKATKDDILKTFSIQQSKISIIYEGVGERYFRQNPPPKADPPRAENDTVQNLKAKYGITKPYLLFVGVWRQYKNLERLSAAFDILKEQGFDMELVIAGKIDPFYPEIRQAVFAIKNQRDIKALGYVPEEDLRALYQGASIFVLPSLTEGFGLIGLEAQASGVPVAASDIPVLREVLGEGAVYFDPKNDNDIAQKIARILKDRDAASEYIERGVENSRRFNWNETAKRTLDVYNSLFPSS